MKNFMKNEYYINRELSWLQFNARVLAEAKDTANPLFERLKFLSISASNLDEFIMVRVGSLKDMLDADYEGRDIAGLTVGEQLDAVAKALHTFVAEQYRTLDMLMPDLEKAGISLVSDITALKKGDIDYLDRYFNDFIYPVLTPMAVDSSRPFPLIRNKTLNLGAIVKNLKTAAEDGEEEFATVQVPDVLPRLIELPAADNSERRAVLLEKLIERNMDKLFLGYEIICTCMYRVARNADLSIDEDDAEDLLKEIEKQLKMRQRGKAIRLEVEKGKDERLIKRLVDELQIEQQEIYEIAGPLDLTFLMKLYSMPGFDEYREHGYLKPEPVPELMQDTDIFEAIREGDILMHHPYQTFEPVVRFIEKAASDPEVLAIKQTLYRVSGNSPIIAALAKAADNGKQVTVLVELKARFDEENNIVWARMLEKAGCHVIYGLVGLKTHCKITLVVRREEDGIRRYVHVATGNYNDSTAKLYTDVGLFTCADAVGEDATAVFNMLSGYSEPLAWNKLTIAPLWLKDRIISLIHRERDHALAGEPARIIAKMNSLCHKDVIAALYEASAAGVKIDLIIRGICCLRTGIKGVSENITVRSIVGNFLEHSRIFFFENGGSPEYYCSSADWMPRNLERRVEIMFPVEEPALRQKLRFILDTELMDTEKARIMNDKGLYERAEPGEGAERLDSQKEFGRRAKEESRQPGILQQRIFQPETAGEG